jgi:hypothetical protein
MGTHRIVSGLLPDGRARDVVVEPSPGTDEPGRASVVPALDKEDGLAPRVWVLGWLELPGGGLMERPVEVTNLLRVVLMMGLPEALGLCPLEVVGAIVGSPTLDPFEQCCLQLEGLCALVRATAPTMPHGHSFASEESDRDAEVMA